MNTSLGYTELENYKPKKGNDGGNSGGDASNSRAYIDQKRKTFKKRSNNDSAEENILNPSLASNRLAGRNTNVSGNSADPKGSSGSKLNSKMLTEGLANIGRQTAEQREKSIYGFIKTEDDDDDDDDDATPEYMLGNAFNPPPYAQMTRIPSQNNIGAMHSTDTSTGDRRPIDPHLLSIANGERDFSALNSIKRAYEDVKEGMQNKGDAPIDHETFEKLDSGYAQKFKKQYAPYYANASGHAEIGEGQRDDLIKKLNYVINMLEDQKDDNTGHVTEEVILYVFMGIFVIFLADSFARSGRYVR